MLARPLPPPREKNDRFDSSVSTFEVPVDAGDGAADENGRVGSGPTEWETSTTFAGGPGSIQVDGSGLLPGGPIDGGGPLLGGLGGELPPRGSGSMNEPRYRLLVLRGTTRNGDGYEPPAVGAAHKECPSGLGGQLSSARQPKRFAPGGVGRTDVELDVDDEA